MRNQYAAVCALVLAAAPLAAADAARAAPAHAIAMQGEPALPADFQVRPFINPDAPQGGTMRYCVCANIVSYLNLSLGY